MAEDDRPDDMSVSGKNEKPRRHPPVIELKATEVGDDASKTAKPEPESEPDPTASASSEQTETKPGSSKSHVNAKAFISALAAGGVGAVAGAALLYFLLPHLNHPTASPDPVLTREIASLSARIEAMSKQPASSQQETALGQRIDKLATVIADTEKRLAATGKPDDVPSEAPPANSLDAASKELREALADLRKLAGQSEQPAVTAAIESLSTRIAALDMRVSSLAAASKSSAGSELAKEISALNALAAAINSGKSFSQELGAARAGLGTRASELEFLDQAASKGIPTTATLAAQFSTLVPELLTRKQDSSGFLSRLYSNASNLIQIRRVGEPVGDDTESVIARIETLLSRGDLTMAIAEAEKLPEPAKSRVAAWVVEANKRRAAELVVKKLQDAVLAVSEQPKS